MVSAVVHSSHRGFVRGRDLFTNVAELEGAVTVYLHDDRSHYLRGTVPFDDLWLTVFVDDIAVAFRNVLRDLRVVRRALDVVSPHKSVMINYVRRPNLVVRSSL